MGSIQVELQSNPMQGQPWELQSQSKIFLQGPQVAVAQLPSVMALLSGDPVLSQSDPGEERRAIQQKCSACRALLVTP